jgi:hypothetical protein
MIIQQDNRRYDDPDELLTYMLRENIVSNQIYSVYIKNELIQDLDLPESECHFGGYDLDFIRQFQGYQDFTDE